MAQFPRAFERFRLSAEELTQFRAEFAQLVETNDLTRSLNVSQVIAKYKKVPGIYVWTTVVRDTEYKIYAGQTNSLSYRVYNYTAPFQPHSPNDFKLLIFRAFLEEVAPEATLRLYFKETPVATLKAEEQATIARYRPLLNVPRPPTPEAKRQLQDAFARYYRSSFEGVLNDEA